MARLGDICKFQSGGTPSKNNSKFYNGTIPWITTVALNGNTIGEESALEWITDEAIQESSAKIVPQQSIMVGTRVGIGKVAINSVPMSTSQDIISLVDIDESIWDKHFLCKFILSKNDLLISQSRGATIKGIRIDTLSNLIVPDILIDEQRKIAAVLDKVSDLIAKRRQQLDKLDELIKARFVEMFGDPRINNLGMELMPMTELCNIIDGDRGKNYPTQDEFSDEGYCLFLNAKNVTTNGFDFENCMFITKEKDELLRKGHLNRGDIVLTTRGTIGNLAFYDNSVPYENIRINSGMVILRMNHGLVSEHFFIEQFKMQLSLIKEKIASGSAQPQLPISTMNKIMMLVPSIELQNQFAAFVKQTEKTKTTISKSLEKLETLKKALMQEYFG